MNLLDILIAKNQSFTGETAKLVQQAKSAMARANRVAAIVDDATAANTAAQSALSAAQSANQEAQTTLTNIETIKSDIAAAAGTVVEQAVANLQSDIDDKITEVTVEDDNTSSVKTKKIRVRKKGINNLLNIFKNYTTTGQNEDGSMTQKAITNALASQKTELENRINNIPHSSGGGTSINLGNAEQGSYVVVGENGNIAASDTNEADMIKTQIIVGTYNAKNAVGLEVDYDNKTFLRKQEAENLSAGANFDKYSMYGGRRRCIVNDSGEIIAFYGDNNYVEDGSLGQVMVYQPKFYYLKAPLKNTKSGNRDLINKEITIISSTKQSGFTIHPLFIDENGNEIDYVLLSAYEGCAYDSSANTYLLNDEQIVDFNNDKLSSIANSKPISGSSQNLTVTNIEKLASNRGTGWHITNLAAESMNQILMSIEYGSLNLQTAFNKGITTLTNYPNVNSSCLTGSTSSLGSTSGMAASTIQTHGNSSETFDTEGKCAISYRGFENPYGNIWRFVGGVRVAGSALVYTDLQNHEHTFSSLLPGTSSWISHFGYDKNMDWALIPTACGGATNVLPVGDYIYVNSNSNNNNCCVIGGKQASSDYAGPFFYAVDYSYDIAAYSYSGRLMHIPTAGTATYLSNIAKWETEVGGE